MSTSGVKPCAEAQLGKTSRTQQEKSSTAAYVHKMDAYESRCRIKESGKQRDEEHIADRGHNSMSPYKLVHLPLPFSKEMKNLEGKAAVDKEWGNLTDVPA